MVPKRSAAAGFLRALPWLAMAVLVPAFPAEAMQAARRGLSIWFDVLFPALFPFFLVTELLIGFGIVHFFGTLFDPLMRPVFRVPGCGGFVMAMGFASGYPIGARLTAELRKQGFLDRTEGERLVAFTTSADPIFLIGAVCVGFFHDPSLAVVLGAAHYGGAVLVGIAMRFYGRGGADKPSAAGAEAAADARLPQEADRGGRNRAAEHAGGPDHPGGPDQSGGLPRPAEPDPAAGRRKSLLRRAVRAMHEARLADRRSAGELLGDAVASGLKLVMMVGAMVVFLSVCLEMIARLRVLELLERTAAVLLGLARLPESLASAFVNGLFEVTLGAREAGAGDGGLVHRAAMAGFVLSWAGFSVHAQIVSLLTDTGLRYRPFAAARLLHAAVAMLLVYALWTPLSGLREKAAHLPAFAALDPAPAAGAFAASLVLFAAAVLALVTLRFVHLLSSLMLSIMMMRKER